MTYADKLKDPRWIAKRDPILQRDRFTCRDCGKGFRSLDVHHCYYEPGEPWDTDDELLLTLCRTCHNTRQEYENAAKLALGLLFAHTNSYGAMLIAERLAREAAGTQAVPLDDRNWLAETRWTKYAEEYPAHRPFVEMVLGRAIWKEAS